MAGPVPYRTNDNKYAPSFPPVVYYRDTFGLDPVSGSRTTESGAEGSDNDSITTKSTIRTTVNNVQTGMYDSQVSKMTPSYHLQVEQVVTTRIITADPRTLLVLSLVAAASAIQLLIFAVICAFYDGCPYLIAIFVYLLLLLNSFVLLIFIKWRPTRAWLIASCIAAAMSFVQSVGIFFWTAFLINSEDEVLERADSRDNRIVTSARIAMYSLQMIFVPIHAISMAVALYIVAGQIKKSSGEHITKGYFLSEPTLGHQKILVPIEVRQVRAVSDEDSDDASIGVQTSGTRSQTQNM